MRQSSKPSGRGSSGSPEAKAQWSRPQSLLRPVRWVEFNAFRIGKLAQKV